MASQQPQHIRQPSAEHQLPPTSIPQQQQQPSPPASRRSEPTEEPKMRGSCQTCVASKLKCSRERPRCSRCVKRDQPCAYVPLKRAGRKPRRAAERVPPYTPSVSIASTAQSPNLTTPIDHLPPVDIPPPMTHLHNTPTDQHLYAAPHVDELRFDDFLSGDLSHNYPVGELDLNLDFPMDSDVLSMQLDMHDSAHASTASSSGIPSELGNPVPQLPFLFNNGIDSSASSLSDNFSIDPPCSCLSQALALMEQLSPTTKRGCTRWFAGPTLDPAADKVTIHTTIDQNKATVEILRAMLDCQCVQDGYVLTIIALLIFKVIGRYAAVVRGMTVPQPWESELAQVAPTFKPSPGGPLPDSMQIYKDHSVLLDRRHNSSNSKRMTALHIFGELHRVRHLVERVSLILKINDERSGGVDNMELCEVNDAGCTDSPLSMSGRVYGQLESDLRRRLKGLSMDLIDRLKRL